MPTAKNMIRKMNIDEICQDFIEEVRENLGKKDEENIFQVFRKEKQEALNAKSDDSYKMQTDEIKTNLYRKFLEDYIDEEEFEISFDSKLSILKWIEYIFSHVL